MKLSTIYESATADMKKMARSMAKKAVDKDEPMKNPHPKDTFGHRVWEEAFTKEVNKLQTAMKKDDRRKVTMRSRK